jgi:hypothetical protein
VSIGEWYQCAGLLALGALHGVNPGMGWLFAVARGCQAGDRGRRAVWGSLGPLAAGHALAIAVAMALAAMLGAVVPMAVLRWLVGAGLLMRGVASLVRHRHPRGGRMLVDAKGLAWWSFLMASAHGAGLMALPLVLPASAPSGGVVNELHRMHAAHDHAQLSLGAGFQMSFGPEPQVAALAATAAHTLGYLLASGLLAIVVHEHLGVRILRSAWVNMDLLWAGALIVTGVAAFF